jgi:hypothetical protein
MLRIPLFVSLYYLFIIALGLYFNADSEKRLEQHIDAGKEELIREGK